MCVFQCCYCSVHHFTQEWRIPHFLGAHSELQELMVCGLQHDNNQCIKQQPCTIPCARCAMQSVCVHTDCYHDPWHIVLVHLMYYCTATLKWCVFSFCGQDCNEILQSKYPNCCLATTQHLVFSVYDLSPCTVIRYSSLHTSSQDRSGTTALMIASFKGHSSVVRKLLQAGATVNTTNWV